MAALEHKPYIVSWNLTHGCNLSCPHCYMDAGCRSAGELTTAQAKEVVDALALVNPAMMIVLTGGEPLLRDDICDIVGYCSDAGFITVLGTNGTLLNKEKLVQLQRAGLKGIGVSIDSTKPESHNAFRNFKGAWELSIECLKAAKELSIETQLDVTLTDENYTEIGDFTELAVSLGARALNFFFLVCTGRAMRTFISVQHYDAAIQELVGRSKTETRTMVRARCAPHIYRVLHEDGVRLPEGTRGCLAGRSYMRIDPVGNVTPCPYMEESVGNVKDTSIEKLWADSQKLQTLRDGEYGGRCGRCEFTEICGGCRARARAEHGDFMAEDPLCLYEPQGKGKLTLTDESQSDIAWESAAKQRINRVPAFIKKMVIGAIEKKAREKGVKIITEAFVEEIKSRDFSTMHRPG
ncbi:MAG: radical SAM protein [Nitrospirae bacterium]|nr:radical SAM protein [Nitrospirota bacterium]MBF0535475.1 radical SAM protein [Nitrospirota bacterium]MBF0617393.1 radical SAM protein [Nitrospirota bacterium]